jgi:hypothetical protein
MKDQPSERQRETDQREPPPPGTLAVIASILAAAFGVQSSRNKERDFRHGNYRHFIIGGIIFTILFVLAVIFVVRMVLESSGG